MSLPRAVLLLTLVLGLTIVGESFCSGTYFYRTSDSGGIVSVPRESISSPTSNPGLYVIPGTEEADAGLSAEKDLLCFLITDGGLLKCMNMTDGSSAVLNTTLSLNSNSSLALDLGNNRIFISDEGNSIIQYAFHFGPGQINITQGAGMGGGTDNHHWTLKSNPESNVSHYMSSDFGSSYVTYVQFTSSFSILGAPSPASAPTSFANADDFIFYTDSDFQLFSINTSAGQYTNSIFRTTLDPIVMMTSTERACNSLIIINETVTSTIVSFLTPNSSLTQDGNEWNLLIDLGNLKTVLSASWTSFVMPYEPWMSIPLPPQSTPSMAPTATTAAPSVPENSSPQSQAPIIKACPEPGPQPIAQFVCNLSSGEWESVSSFAGSDLSLSTPVTISGNLDVSSNSITFNGLGSRLNISGCAVKIGSIVLSMTPAELQSILDTPDRSRLLITSSCPTDALSTVPVSIKATPKKKCQEVSAKPKSSETTLLAILDVNSTKCNMWWIILVSVLGGVIVIAIVIALIFMLNPKLRRKIRPFQGTESRITRSHTRISLPKRVNPDSAYAHPSSTREANQSGTRDGESSSDST